MLHPPQIYGLLLPYCIAMGCFFWIITKRKPSHLDNVYGLCFTTALIYAFLTPLLSSASWTAITETAKQTHLFSLFPVLVWLCAYIDLRLYKTTINISLSWIFFGTFCSLLVADATISYHAFSDFKMRYIGGAGIKDGLVIVPFYATVITLLLNKASSYTLRTKIKV